MLAGIFPFFWTFLPDSSDIEKTPGLGGAEAVGAFQECWTDTFSASLHFKSRFGGWGGCRESSLLLKTSCDNAELALFLLFHVLTVLTN